MAGVVTKSMKKEKKPGIQLGKNPSAIELIILFHIYIERNTIRVTGGKY